MNDSRRALARSIKTLAITAGAAGLLYIAPRLADHAPLNPEEAEIEKCRKAAAEVANDFGPNHLDTIDQRLGFSVMLRDAGQFAESDECLRQAVAAVEQRLNLDDRFANDTVSRTVQTLSDARKRADAERLARQNFDAKSRRSGFEDSDTRYAAKILALALFRWGEYNESAGLYRQMIEGFEASGSTAIRVLRGHELTLAMILERAGEHDDAEIVHRRCLARAQDDEKAAIAEHQGMVFANFLVRRGKPAEAITITRGIIAAMERADRQYRSNYSEATELLASLESR